MPDRFRFDHLGARVECIDCSAGGPRWEWPRALREEHAEAHGFVTLTPGGVVPCAACGKPLSGRRSSAKYCSAACRQAAYRERGGAA